MPSVLNIQTLQKLFRLNPPAKEAAIVDAFAALDVGIPPQYAEFLQTSNGLETVGCLMLLAAEDLVERNADYEMHEYLPGFVMIGDDSGGTALVMKENDPEIYEVSMGVLDDDTLEQSASSIHELLIVHQGKTLAERTSQ